VHPASEVGRIPPATLDDVIAEARRYSFDFLEWKKRFVLRQHWQVHTRRTCPECGGPVGQGVPGHAQAARVLLQPLPAALLTAAAHAPPPSRRLYAGASHHRRIRRTAHGGRVQDSSTGEDAPQAQRTDMEANTPTLDAQRLGLALKAGGLASWDWDIHSGQVTWSDEHYRIQGYRPGSGTPSLEAWLERVHPDDRAEAVRVLQEAQRDRTDYVHQFRCLWPDGTVRYCAARGLYYYDDAGAATRMIGVIEDITEQMDAEQALRESESRFRQFGDASPNVLWIRDADTLELEYLSQAFDRIYGMDRQAMLAAPGLDSWLDLILPDDRPALHAAIARVRAGERVTTEYRVVRRDGETRWLRNTKFPLRDDGGRVVRIGGIGHDATEERRASDLLQIMLAELQHRTRNLMAVVQSVTQRTLRDSLTLDDFRAVYTSRLGAITRVHGLLSRMQEGDRVAFDALLDEELQAHGVDARQVSLEGPAGLRLRSATLQTFALALHELATNAVKYGALSSDAGRLRIAWRRVAWEDGTPALRVEWRETGVRGGPEAATPSSGYGRELIEKALPYQLNARTSYQLLPEGVDCVVEVPLEQS